MLTDVAAELVLGASGYAATNLENVVILVGVYCANSGGAMAVRLGFAAGSLILLLVSLATIPLAGLIPVQYLGLLGVIPIGLGIRELVRGTAPDEASGEVSVSEVQSLLKVSLSATILMVANGGDTVAVFAPLFAETETFGIGVITVGYLLSTLALTLLAGRVCTHPSLSEPLQRYGPKIAPYIMIAIGIYILLNTGTDTLPD